MHKTTLNLAALIAAALLTACGGGSDDAITPADNGNRNAGNVTPTPNNGGNTGTRNGKILIPAPAQPTAAETAAFNTGKQFRTEAVVLVSDGFRPYTINANGRTLVRAYKNGDTGLLEGDFRSLPSGFSSITGTGTESGSSTTMPASIRSYQGFRSGVTIVYNTNDVSVVYLPYGIHTPPVTIPTAGKATYTGTAFDRNERGGLTYNVDFGAKSGEGRIDGLSRYGNITLAKSNFGTRQMLDGNTATGIAGTASTTDGDRFAYSLGFYGDHAEEISGFAVNNSLEGIGLHGTRGAITE